ncbi:MAG: GHKL domain-containing protein [Oscillospiraceae bacterium]|nr:GHKL domain-containing protein [Oscillospiraceae bacterium]
MLCKYRFKRAVRILSGHCRIGGNKNGLEYIVSTNSFDRKTLKSKDGKYLSTKHSGQVTGLSSIAAAAEKYGGSANFYNSDSEFYADVVLKV